VVKRNTLPVASRDTLEWMGVQWPLTPKLAALPTPLMQKFVIAFALIVKPGHGAKAKAAKLAGYNATPKNQTSIAIHLLLREDVQEAIAEMDGAHQAELRPQFYKQVKRALADPASKHHGRALEFVGQRVWQSEQHHRHTHELAEDKAEIFLKLVEQRIREGRSDKEIRAELERQGDAAAVSAADYYLARARATAIDVQAVEVPEKPKLIEAAPTEAVDDDNPENW
jgi:hypothetical protein